jgi:hypothetical protein
MNARPRRTVATDIDGPNEMDLARLDDDGGFRTPIIPGAREPVMLTTFGMHAIVIPDSPTTMDAATIAARQREGGGAPNQRRPAHEGSAWKRLGLTLCRFLIGH